MSDRATGVALFAVEDTTAQMIWSKLGPGHVDVQCGDVHHSFEADGGPGSIVLDDLAPDTAYLVSLTLDRHPPITRRFRTLAPPPGEELFRFATLSDLHIGRDHFGLVGKIREDAPQVPHPMRCAGAAIDELLAWGAEHLVIKGDLVDSGQPAEWDDARRLLADLPIPLDVIAGNHESSVGEGADPFPQAERVGLRLHREVSIIDVDGLRLVLMDSSIPRVDIGRWHHLVDEAVDAVGGAQGPAMLIVHHHPMPLPFPTFLPRGVPSISARRLIRRCSQANPDLIGTSGHTHRNRRRDICGVPWTEVGSPKDYPGVWAGYVVHEGGIRQVVRRIERRDCLDWLERTKQVAFGAWGLWSPGTLEDRCFTYRWPSISAAG